MVASDCFRNKFSEYPRDIILGISIIVCSIPQHFLWFENCVGCVDSQSRFWHFFRLWQKGPCFGWHGSSAYGNLVACGGASIAAGVFAFMGVWHLGRWLVGYLGLVLVFVWGGARWGVFDFRFSRVFC